MVKTRRHWFLEWQLNCKLHVTLSRPHCQHIDLKRAVIGPQKHIATPLVLIYKHLLSQITFIFAVFFFHKHSSYIVPTINAMDVRVLCIICGSSDARRCAQCRSAAYCSVECQQTDWRAHQLLCKKFKEASADGFAARPLPKHHLAIYFPMSKNKPRLV